MTNDMLFKESKILILCAPLNESTRGMISREQFAAMRDDALLVNAARGPLVDTGALLEALQTKQIAGAVMDVTDSVDQWLFL